MFVLGIDPGITGALVLLNDEALEVIDWLDMPIVRSGKTAWVDGVILGDWLEEHPPTVAVIELVHTYAANEGTEQSGKQRGMATSIAMLTRLAGGIETMLSAQGIPFVHVTSTMWKRRALLLRREKKDSLALARARLRWPEGGLTLEKHHGRAEAALIALFGYRPAGAPAPKHTRVEQAEIDRRAAENLPPGHLFELDS